MLIAVTSTARLDYPHVLSTMHPWPDSNENK
jgi:hypothetical protein